MGCCFVKPPIPQAPKTIATIIPADQQHYYEDLTYGQRYYPPPPIRVPQAPNPDSYEDSVV
jgi:hypothetical protein